MPTLSFPLECMMIMEILTSAAIDRWVPLRCIHHLEGGLALDSERLCVHKPGAASPHPHGLLCSEH